ncbi:MAG: tetratricopeptide repeat protein [Spirosomataceae bacterium]
MKLIHTIDDFLYLLFPTIEAGDLASLQKHLQDFYTVGAYKPSIRIEENQLIVEFDDHLLAQKADYHRVTSLCEKGKFKEAKLILNDLLVKNPTVSEYHRIMGQILSEEGDQEEAINFLIDALRWDSKNGWALLMMGNIFSKFKNDVPTAMKYYDQALIANPKDNITVNNIGVNLMQLGQLEEAKMYLHKATTLDSTYPYSYLALAMIAEKEENIQTAFENALLALKNSRKSDVIYQNAFHLAFRTATQLSSSDTGKRAFDEYKNALEKVGERMIEVELENEIATPAKIEFAENYGRDKHIVKFKPGYPAVEHLVLHELVHLDFVIQAQKEKANQLFVSDGRHQAEFIREIDATIRKFKKMGIPENDIDQYAASLFDGLNRQIYNAPIDLFIEDFLFTKYPNVRPFQFLSLYALIQESIKAVTDKQIVELSPKEIISKSKTYNLLSAMQFKELFGIDLVDEYKPTTEELTLAKQFYSEFLEYKVDKEPGEEYELILNWAGDLGINKYFELVDEIVFRTKRSNIDNLLNAIETDPYDQDEGDLYKQKEIEKFQASQNMAGLNEAVVMYMVDALQFFSKMSKEEIKRIAFEIAMQGAQGYSLEKKDYKLATIPGKTFSGYHILSYYYVSWALAIPEMLRELQMPYDAEYAMALQLFDKK